MEKISAVYKILNTVTNDCYIGSSKDVKRRWHEHKRLSVWKKHLNSPLYQDMQKYGVDKFRFQILCPVTPDCLKQVEQELIEMIKPTYNDRKANGWDVERRKESNKTYYQSNKHKETIRNYNRQICFYNGKTLTLNALAKRFGRVGIKHPNIEAKKYILKEG